MINMRASNFNNQLGQKQKNNNQSNVNKNQVAFGIQLFNRQSASQTKEAEKFRELLEDEFDDQLNMVKNMMGQEQTAKTDEEKPAKTNNTATSTEFKTDARHVLVNPVKTNNTVTPTEFKTDARNELVHWSKTNIPVAEPKQEYSSKAAMVRDKVLSAFEPYKHLYLSPLQKSGIISEREAVWIEYRDEKEAKLKPEDEKEYALLEKSLKDENYKFKPNNLKKLYQLLTKITDKELEETHKAKEAQEDFGFGKLNRIKDQVLCAFDQDKRLDLNRLVKQNELTDQEAKWIKFSRDTPILMRDDSNDYNKLELKLATEDYKYDLSVIKRLYSTLSQKWDIYSYAMLAHLY